MKKILYGFLLLIQCALYAKIPEVLTVDFDDVLSIKQKVGFSDYASVLPRIFFGDRAFL